MILMGGRDNKYHCNVIHTLSDKQLALFLISFGKAMTIDNNQSILISFSNIFFLIHFFFVMNEIKKGMNIQM